MAKLSEWLTQFEARSRRDRLLLLLALQAGLLLLGYLLWIGPQWQERQRWNERLASSEQESARIADQNRRLESVLQQGQERDNQRRLQQLEAVSAQLDRSLQEAQANMLSPQRMPEVLRDMLKDLPLVLLNLRKLPPEVELDSGVEELPKIYRHGLRLELEGSYGDTLDYIERLEQLPWGLSWEALDIHMQNYPKARIILHVYTLSLQEEWLGV